MSINMYVGEVRQQVQSINSSCQSTIATMEQIQQALSAIIIEPSLRGVTYDSMKNYFNSVYMPVTKGFILVCERMIEANQQFLNRYLDQVDVNSLQESVLEERIRQYNRLSEMLDSIVDPVGFNARMIDGLQEMRQQTIKKLDALREYDYFSIQIFDELESQLATLEAGVSILAEGKAWNQSTGTFSTMGLNLDWAGDINQSWKAHDDKKKGIDEDKNKKLAKYTIIKCYDPVTKKTTWALEKDGLGVTDPELTAYLRKVGKYLDKDTYSVIELSPKEWETRVNNAWKINGTEYFSGKQYGWWVSVLAHGQDAKGKLAESGVWDSLWTLGMIYGAVKSINKFGKIENNVPDETLKHADLGDFNSNNRLINGGHGENSVAYLKENNIEFIIVKEYSNGVRVGNIPTHKNKMKRTGTGQSWFPENWDTAKIKEAGNYINSLPENKNLVDGQWAFAEFDGVRVGIIKKNGEIMTIIPDNSRQP